MDYFTIVIKENSSFQQKH